MRAYLLSIFLLLMVSFGLATTLEPWFQSWAGSRTQSDNMLQVALGDSRRMFARHFYTKADAYFHNGYYPSIYDTKEDDAKERNAVKGAHEHEGHTAEECADSFLGQPKDWIDRFSRHFFASQHTHLGGSDCGHDCCKKSKAGQGHDETCEHKGHEAGHHHGHEDEHEHAEAAKAGPEREILPWLRLSAEMDPQRVETYVIAAFWLRSKLGKVDEAEQFLREGLRANPGDCEIQFALGMICYENRKDIVRGRNLLELSLNNWREKESRKPEPNLLLLGQILNQLAKLEREQKNYPRAVEIYTLLKQVSPNKEAVQTWIDEMKTNLPPSAVAAPR